MTPFLLQILVISFFFPIFPISLANFIKIFEEPKFAFVDCFYCTFIFYNVALTLLLKSLQGSDCRAKSIKFKSVGWYPPPKTFQCLLIMIMILKACTILLSWLC